MQAEPYKYPLQEQPDYFPEIQAQVQGMEPPEFATQGEPAGKVRGRKKQKEPAKPKAKAKARAAKSKVIAQAKAKMKGPLKQPPTSKPKRKSNTRQADRSNAATPEPKRRKHSKAGAAHDEYVPPEHVTLSHVYSSAYRKALSQHSDDVAYAKLQAKAATALWREKGVVNSLCGVFKVKPRARNVD